jgi:glutamate--cysteine ligase
LKIIRNNGNVKGFALKNIKRQSTVVKSDDNLSIEQLVAYFQGGEKPFSQFRVGTEHEKFGYHIPTRQPLSYDGRVSIVQIFKSILASCEAHKGETPWQPIMEGAHMIGVSQGGASISLEPAGQLELSGAPLASIHETAQEVKEHFQLLRRICIPSNVGFIATGYHPFYEWHHMPQIPKERYGIMRAYMPTKGKRGLEMMHSTTTIQANLDFENENQMVEMFKLSVALTPLVTALFANSPFRGGRISGALSERSLTWLDTDPDRSGFPPCVFEADFGYEKWLQTS